MRIKLAADLVSAYKIGDKKRCSRDFDETKIAAYCDKNFFDSPT